MKRTVRGRIHYVRIDSHPLEDATDWRRGYEKLWDTRITRLVELPVENELGERVLGSNFRDRLQGAATASRASPLA